MTTVTMLLVTVVLALAGALLVWFVVTRRSRKKLDELLARVEELEQRLSEGATKQDTTEVQVPEESVAGAVSSDALAGWTSHVGRMLAAECEPRDLAELAVVAVYRRVEDSVRPSDLADELAVSLRSLQRGLLSALNCSPSDLILTVKMREARRMLESGRFRVGEVAHHLAFADAAHFSRRYRQFYRCPPSRHVGSGGANRQ